MAIVPSGNRRLMKFQQSTPNAGTPAPRSGVEQEDIGGKQEGDAGFNPIGQLGNTLQQQKQQPATKPNVPSQQELSDAVGGQETAPEVAGKIGPGSGSQGVEADSTQVGDDFRDAYFKIMEGLGIEPRMFNHPQHAEKFFHIDEEVIGNGEAKGFFILPSKTQAKAISKDEAWNIAKQLGSKFGVTKMNFTYAPGNNYKFNFQVLVQDNSDMTNSSLDALISGGKQQMARAASSKNALIKESRSNIVSSLMKQGFGGTNAS